MVKQNYALAIYYRYIHDKLHTIPASILYTAFIWVFQDGQITPKLNKISIGFRMLKKFNIESNILRFHRTLVFIFGKSWVNFTMPFLLSNEISNLLSFNGGKVLCQLNVYIQPETSLMYIQNISK